MPKNRILLLVPLLLISLLLPAQRVGLVLSGGGARGIAHIGLIQALEDHEIPIDYITGTSMGAIVGSMYAMGYSTEDMIKLIESDDFKLWQAGELDKNLINYFKLEDPTPSFFSVETSLRDSAKSISFLPSSLINPAPMNFAFLKLFASATVRSKGNFNNLFVPFRAVASDVYNKEAVILESGSLGDAVRASMTFPFFFKPIEINGVLVYDGGIYNNFPVDVMKEDFAPDFIIGSVVSDNPSKPEEGDLMTQIDNMVMQKTNYKIDSIDGVLIKFDLKDVSLLDMHKAREIYKIGYEKGMEYIQEIENRVDRRISKTAIEINRKDYKSQDPVIRFDSVRIEGVNNAQRSYLRKQFRFDPSERLTIGDAEKTYINLLSDSRIAEIMPTVVLTDSGHYDLNLKVKLKQHLETSIGGLVSSTNDNRIYLGAKYQLLSSFAADLGVNAQIGKAYNSVEAKARMYLPTNYPLYLETRGAFITKKYFEDNNPFSISDDPSYIQQREGYFKFDVGMPLGIIGKMVYGLGYGRLRDTYSEELNINTPDQNELPSKSYYDLFNLSGDFYIDRIVEKDFPTKGYMHEVKSSFNIGSERYMPSQSLREFSPARESMMWLQMRYFVDYYLNMNDDFSLGLSGDWMLSNKPNSSNYTATLVNAAAFTPTIHSKTVFNSAFRSNNFFAVGVKPIWKINKTVQLRSEFYSFQNLQKLSPENITRYKRAPLNFAWEYVAEVSAVLKLPFISLSAFVNHYSAPKANWNFGLNIGFMLDTPRFNQ